MSCKRLFPLTIGAISDSECSVQCACCCCPEWQEVLLIWCIAVLPQLLQCPPLAMLLLPRPGGGHCSSSISLPKFWGCFLTQNTSSSTFYYQLCCQSHQHVFLYLFSSWQDFKTKKYFSPKFLWSSVCTELIRFLGRRGKAVSKISPGAKGQHSFFQQRFGGITRFAHFLQRLSNLFSSSTDYKQQLCLGFRLRIDDISDSN